MKYVGTKSVPKGGQPVPTGGLTAWSGPDTSATQSTEFAHYAYGKERLAFQSQVVSRKEM